MTKRGKLTFLLLPVVQAFVLSGLLPGVMQDATQASIYGPETTAPEPAPSGGGPVAAPGSKLREPERPGDQSVADPVEFYNDALKHYFITASVLEAHAIDGGAAGPGWSRTAQSFRSGGPNAVCRFHGTPGVGPNSHFYTVDPEECAATKRDPGWSFEGYAFAAHRPGADGACPPDTAPIKRLYNGRFAYNDSNHRFVTSDALYDEMLGQGWEGEGVALCVPR